MSKLPLFFKTFISTDGKIFTLGVNSSKIKNQSTKILFQDSSNHSFWKKTNFKSFNISSSSRVNSFANRYKIIKR